MKRLTSGTGHRHLRDQVSQFTFELFQSNLSLRFGGSAESPTETGVCAVNLGVYVLRLMGRLR